MSNTRPLRVLHIVDTLGGGGSERLVWDIVRLSDQTRVKHRVVTIFPDGYLLPFVYAEPLRQLGAYGRTLQVRGDLSASSRDTEVTGSGEELSPARSDDTGSSEATVRSRLSRAWKFIVRALGRLPRGLKKPLALMWNSAFSAWRHIRRAAAHFPSLLKIPAEYFLFRPDIIHAHGFYGFKYGLLFKRLFRRPMVHMVPALFSQMEAQGTGWLADHYRRFHRLVDYFTLDPGYRGELLGVGVPAKKLFEISGTLDLQAIARVKAERERHRVEVRARLGIPENAIVALSVGRLDPTKGHSYTVEALPGMLKQFPALHWILLGEGAIRSELESRIKELGVEQHAHLVGFDREPLPYYAAADIYLRTTTMEGENLSSRQAIAMGLPTVGFDSCPETDLIGKLGHGIVVPNADAAALASATCEILSLPDRGCAMGALGVAYSNATMGIQKHVDSLLSVYAHLHGKVAMAQGETAELMPDR
jgi:glycosyltransferase involved in cell wall biosynthesis